MLTWRGIADELKLHRVRLLQANVIALLAVAAAVPVPLLLPLMVDEVLLHHPGAFVARIGAAFPSAWHGPVLFIGVALLLTVALRLTAILLNVWQGRTFSLLAKDVVYRIRVRMLARLSRIALSEFETVGAGRVTSHFVTDLNAIDGFLGSSISGLVVSVLTLVGVAAVLFWMHWQLALFIVLLNPVVILFSTRLGKRVKDLKKHENRAFEVFQEALSETLDALTQIRAMNREKHYLARVTDKAADIRQHAAAFAWKSDAMSRISFFVFLAGFDAFRAGAMLMVVFSNLTIGEMLAVFGYLWFMMTPVQELVNMQYSWFAANAALGRINALLGLHGEPQHPAQRDPFAGQATVGIALDHVSFAYADGETVLDDVSLTVTAGEKVALVGASGGGKSTLVQALLGLYPVKSGQIYLWRHAGHRNRLGNGARTRRRGAAASGAVQRQRARQPHPGARGRRRHLVAGAGNRPVEGHHRRAAARAGYGGGAAGRAPVRWPAATAGDRAHDRRPTADRHPRRSHLRTRHRHRTAAASGTLRVSGRPHHAHHRASFERGEAGRPHPGVRKRPRGGGGRPRRADRPGRAVSQALPPRVKNAGENQRFLIDFAELCIQQWAGQAFAAVPRDCSHSPIVFDLSFVPPGFCLRQ